MSRAIGVINILLTILSASVFLMLTAGENPWLVILVYWALTTARNYLVAKS